MILNLAVILIGYIECGRHGFYDKICKSNNDSSANKSSVVTIPVMENSDSNY